MSGLGAARQRASFAEVKAELAGYGSIKMDGRRHTGKIAELDQRLSGKIAELDKKMAVLQWMMGATLTGVAAIIVKLFFVA